MTCIKNISNLYELNKRQYQEHFDSINVKVPCLNFRIFFVKFEKSCTIKNKTYDHSIL